VVDASPDIRRLIDRARDNILAAMAREDVPGTAVCLVCDGKPAWVEAFGVTDHKSKHPVGVDTIFSIQSTSKNLSTTAIMLAVQRGLLDLDRPVTTWLPDFTVHSRFESNPERQITLRHLLSHRGGFTHEAPVGNNYEPSFPSFEAHVRSISRTWLRAPVGRRYYYSNLGIDLAGYALQTVSRKPFAECLKESIFEPLGMADTTAATDVYARRSNRAIGHSKGFEAVPLELPFIPSGGVYASARDMAEYLLFHLNRGRVRGKPLLEPWLWNEMHSFSFPGAYSLGIAGGDMRFGNTDIRMLRHTGGGMGFSSDFCFYPQAGVGVAVLFNRAVGAAFQLGRDLAEEILVGRYGEKQARIRIEEQSPMNVSQGELLKFVGNWLGRGVTLDLSLEQGALVTPRGSDRVPLRVTSPVDVMIPPDRPSDDASELRYLPAENGASAQLEGILGDGNFDYNDGPNDRPGPGKAEWGHYLGDYWIYQWGRRVQQVKVQRKNGYLYLDATRLVAELEPGLFFTSDNEAVDFRGSDPTWGNIYLRRA
jgi:CubicO group peptidase (beta-lactamase class C family)